MVKVPSKDEFAITLAAISERDMGTPELLNEAEILEPTEEAISAFLEKKAGLIDTKRNAVHVSPVPTWLRSQTKYLQGLELAFKKRPKQLSRKEWLAKSMTRYLNAYKPVPESNFRLEYYDPECWDEEKASEYLASHNSEAKRRKRFHTFVTSELAGIPHAWDSTFISALNDYIQGNMNVTTRKRNNSEFKNELAAIDTLMPYVEKRLKHLYLRDSDGYEKMLKMLRTDIEDECRFSPLHYIQSGNDTSPERELILTLWVWFNRARLAVSAKTLHHLLDIKGISKALPTVRSIERNISDWKGLEKERQ